MTPLARAMLANPFTRKSLDNLNRKRASGIMIDRNAAIRLLMNNARDTDRRSTTADRHEAAECIFNIWSKE